MHCLECNYKTTMKSFMDKHVHSLHVSVDIEEVNVVCGKCNHEFDGAEHDNMHVIIQDKQNESTNVKIQQS